MAYVVKIFCSQGIQNDLYLVSFGVFYLLKKFVDHYRYASKEEF